MEEDICSSQDELRPPQVERWAPVGAAASPDAVVLSEPRSTNYKNELLETLENEKEELQQSLFSLTSRFAQIQFRLHQIVEAEPSDRDNLLQELDELANQGCIDSSGVFQNEQDPESSNDGGSDSNQLKKHEEIIQELKHQLDDLENYAFKHGSGGVPQSIILQKQQVVLEQLMAKLNLKVDSNELALASVDDLKCRVDTAVAEIVNPAKIKEKLIDHLQTQIQDLERFVQFLQVEVESEDNLQRSSGSVPFGTDGSGIKEGTDGSGIKEKRENLAMLRRALRIIQVFALTQLGCGTKAMQAETIEEPNKVGTQSLLNDLKSAVNKVKKHMVSQSQMSALGQSKINEHELFYGEIEDNERVAALAADNELTQLVRKELCPSITKLLSHGLVVDATVSSNTGIVAPISCLLPRKLNSSLASKPLHPWELFMGYYEMKQGAQLAKAPSRMLTRSFDLEPLVSSGGDHRISIKHSLLEAINMVLKDHHPLKRSFDVMLKALICIGLNSGRLAMWIRLLMKTSSLISTHYTDYSYVAQTGFEGALTVLGRLDSLPFTLPEDLAIRPFKNIRDAF